MNLVPITANLKAEDKIMMKEVLNNNNGSQNMHI